MTSVFYLSRITPNIINNIKMWWPLSRWPFEPPPSPASSVPSFPLSGPSSRQHCPRVGSPFFAGSLNYTPSGVSFSFDHRLNRLKTGPHETWTLIWTPPPTQSPFSIFLLVYRSPHRPFQVEGSSGPRRSCVHCMSGCKGPFSHPRSSARCSLSCVFR